jgi:hypothetical protein
VTDQENHTIILVVTNNLDQQDVSNLQDFLQQLQQPKQFTFFTSRPIISLLHILSPIEDYLTNTHNLFTLFTAADDQYCHAIDTLRNIESDLGVEPGSGHLRNGNFQDEIIMHIQDLKPKYIYLTAIHAAPINHLVKQQQIPCSVISATTLAISHNNP